MPSVYSRTTKIHDAVGRSRYISGLTGKQEEVVLHNRQMQHDWTFHSEYEKTHEHNPGQRQNEAREIVVALPNDLASVEKDGTSLEQKDMLTKICDDLTLAIVGPNHDYEYCVHWNTDRTNLHLHMMFSERKNVEAHPMQYKKDIWQDPRTGRLAKAGSEGAILVHKKGDLQYDKEGNPKYNTDLLSPKDRRFKAHSFMAIRDRQIQAVMRKYGYDFSIQDKSTPYLSQRKLYKYAREDYKQAASEYNAAVREYNAAVKEHLAMEPDQLDHYREIRADVETEVKAANHVERKISSRAIVAVHTMAMQVKEFIRSAAERIRADVSGWWMAVKDRTLAAFRDQISSSNNNAEVFNGNRERTERSVDSFKSAKHENLGVGKREICSEIESPRERISALRDYINGGGAEGKPQSTETTAGREQVTQRIA